MFSIKASGFLDPARMFLHESILIHSRIGFIYILTIVLFSGDLPAENTRKN